MVHCGPCPWCFTKCGPKEVKEILVDSIAGKSFSLQVYPYKSNGAFLPPRASPLYRSTTPTLFLKTLLSCRVPIHSINFFFYLRCYLQIIYSKHTKTMPKMVETWTQNTFLNAQPQVLSGKTLKYICNIISLKQTKFVGSQSSYSRCWSYRDQKLTLDRKGTRKKKQKNKKTQEHDWSRRRHTVWHTMRSSNKLSHCHIHLGATNRGFSQCVAHSRAISVYVTVSLCLINNVSLVSVTQTRPAG